MRFALLVAALAACGDSTLPCNYTEADDVGNGSASEMTGFSLGKKVQIVCGNVDGGHYDAAQKLVDVDRYRVTVGGTGELVIHLDPLEMADVLSGVQVQIFDTAVNPRLFAEGRFDPAYDHGAFVTVLPPGDYDVILEATAGGDIMGGKIGYRLRFTPDPSLTCKALTKASFTEAAEATNDSVIADFTKTPSFTMGAGMPEATKLTFDGGGHYLIAGAAQGGPLAGEYVDSDVYAVKSGDGVNEMTVRLDWDGAGADLDYALLDATTLEPAGISVLTQKTSGELATFAVHPKTDYLLWVGDFQGSSNTAYGVTVCADHYTP